MLSVPLFSHAANSYTHHAFVCDVCTKVIPLTIPVSEMVYGAGDLAEEGAYLIVTGAVQLLSPAAPSKRKKIGGTSGGTSARAKHAMAEAASRRSSAAARVWGSSALGSTRRFDRGRGPEDVGVADDLGAGFAVRAGPGASTAVDRFTENCGTRDKMHP